MARYFFDTYESDALIKDETGIECGGIEAARNEALAGLIDLARDSLKGVDGHQLAIEIRDENDKKLVRLSLSLQMLLTRRPTAPTAER
ncbi:MULTISPECIES: DUF6894 family protein [Mesorhizobium]|uniref:DUF6894 domain-containing protein n=1 Tax=Mesorhizobium australicum (strain HAMBI 3006 / LMG 24608 / WSM2073) TaxID=754035 RepID=L0KIU2_MESAW|nr:MULTISPECIES: hypothetical protein [Mesorhizobium]AGB45262.1 hypothetical protein Mesau_02876 [Mesorhizobium australicum WSM2073]MBZ9683665.1 hypothetical protein [Mesorhizobium sp. CO1-1-2]MBZ9696546.1 hypothetical protein [Mesorhizobium sp. CO1-1-9]MBZ9725463.1 hypothetical protein [Mesorhizobium sp. CO1-1-11]MBZ9923602.1 hypothetical protein [Mesorhizobium sp. BR1-1-4]